MPSYTNPTELPIWIEPQQNLVSLSGFGGYSNLQTEIVSFGSNAQSQIAIVSNLLTTQLTSQVATINTTISSLSSNTAYNVSNLFNYINTTSNTIITTITTLAGNTVSQFNNVYSYINIVQGNLYSVSNTLSTSIISLNSNLSSQVAIINSNLTTLGNAVNNLSAYVSSQVATLSSQITICQGNIASIGASVSNIRGDIANIYSTSTLQYSNIYSTIANIHPSNLSGYIQYSNLNTIDVRQLSNTSNILYQGANVSLLNNDALYITADSSPTFNNITINGTANVGTVLNVPVANTLDIYCTDEYVSNSIQIGISPNVLIIEVVPGRSGGSALKIAQDVASGVSMLMDSAGIAMGIGSAIKSMFNTDGTPSDLQEEAVPSAVDWSTLHNAPLGYRGTLVKDVGIQNHLYFGGSLYYDNSYTDITENPITGSVLFTGTGGGVKIIDGQSQTGIFNTLTTGDVVCSANVKTDDIRAYTPGTPLYIFQDINAQGNISSQLYITATKDISTSANISSNYLVATNNITSNTINTTGFVGSRVKFFQDVEFVGNVRCDTNEAVYGALTANSIYVNYDSIMGGNIQCNNLFFGGNVYYNSSIVQFSQWSGNTKQISYTGNVIVNGNIQSSNYFINSSNIQQYILNTVGNNYWIGNTNSISTTANASVNNLAVNNLKASGNGTIYCYSNVVFVNSSLTLDPADLIVELDAVVWGNLTVLTDVVCNNYIVGNTSLYNYIIQTVGNTQISVSNITNIYSNTINTNVIYSSNIYIAGNTLSQYITNITGNTALLVSNVYLQSNYVNNAYIQNNFATASSLTAFVGNNSSYASNAYIQNQYVSKTQGNAWYLSGSGYISNNSSYNAVVGSLNATSISVSGTNLTSIYQPIGSYLTSVPTGFSVSSATFTSSINLPYASTFNGKASSLNNDVPFLTSVPSTAIPGINSTGTVAINQASGNATLDVNGALRSTGCHQQSFVRSGMGTSANIVGNIASFTGGLGSYNFDVDVITTSGYPCHLSYKIAAGWNSTNGAWNRCIPLSSSMYSNTTEAYELQFNNPGYTNTFRLVHSVSTGIYNTVSVNIKCYYNGGDAPTVVDLTGQATTTDANWATYNYHRGTALSQYNNQVGVNTIYPGTTLDVNGTIRGTNYIFPLGTWLTSTDGKNRLYFGATGKTYYASASGDHEWKIDSAGSTMGMTLSATSGAIYTLGNGQFNNCKVGDPGFGTNYTGFGHSATFGTSNYAILADYAGITYLNCASGQAIYFRISNGNVGNWTSSGLAVGSGTVASYPLDVSGAMRITGNFNMATTGTPTIFGVGNDIQFSSAGITLSSVGILYLTTVNGIVGTGVSAWSGAMTVGSGTTQTTYPLKVVGNTFTSGCFVGSIAPSGLVNYCPNSLTLYGTSSSITGGAHIQGFTNADSYSTYQLLNWTHDNMCLGFDSQFNGSNWVSCYSSAPSYQIYKTGGCLNFNYAPTTSASSTITNTTTMCINTNKIGILNTSPAYNLDVSGNCRITNGFTSSAFSGVGITTPAYWLDVQGTSISTAIFNVGYASPYSVFTVRGSAVGILNAVPSYNLDVNGNMRVINGAYFNGTDAIAIGTIAYMTTASTLSTGAYGATTAGYAIIGGRIRGSQIDIFSDRRIKTDITPRDTAKDLEMLSKIPMRDYKYIDKVHHSAKPHLGVISQEIENIVPDAVNHSKHTIPDVYKIYDIVEIDDKTFTIVGATLEDKTKVRMYYEKGGKEIKFKGIVDGKSIRHKQGRLNTDKVFVYGKEVDDFLNVNYNHLYSMNIGATQELVKLVRELQDRLTDVEKELAQYKKYSYTAGRI